MILRVFSKPVLAACALVLGLGVTASYGDDDHEHTGADPRLGDRVMQACGGGGVSGWRTLKGENNVVLLEFGINDWYYAELSGPCSYGQLRSAFQIGVDSFSKRCVSRGDKLIFIDHGRDMPIRCLVTALHAWDPDATADEENDESGDDE